MFLVFSLHTLLTIHGHRNLKRDLSVWQYILCLGPLGGRGSCRQAFYAGGFLDLLGFSKWSVIHMVLSGKLQEGEQNYKQWPFIFLFFFSPNNE